MSFTPLRLAHTVNTMRSMNKVRRAGVSEPAFKKALGKVVAALRKGADLTQAEFANRLDVDQTTVTKVETGVHLWRMETWLKAGEVLEVDFYEMFKCAANPNDDSGGAMGRKIVALEPDELALVKLFRLSNEEGREAINAAATHYAKMHPKDSRVVPMSKPGKRRALQ